MFLLTPEFQENLQAIQRLGFSFQTKPQDIMDDVSDVKKCLKDWTFHIDFPEDPMESDWEFTRNIGDGYLIKVWFDCPKRLNVHIASETDIYNPIGIRWIWSWKADEPCCYATKEPGYDSLSESCKTWLNEVNGIFRGIDVREF